MEERLQKAYKVLCVNWIHLQHRIHLSIAGQNPALTQECVYLFLMMKMNNCMHLKKYLASVLPFCQENSSNTIPTWPFITLGPRLKAEWYSRKRRGKRRQVYALQCIQPTHNSYSISLSLKLARDILPNLSLS